VKVVFDTNVLIAAFVSEGICSKLLIRARKKQFELFTCPFIIKEFKRVFHKKFSATQEEVRAVTMLISEAAETIAHPIPKVAGVCRDPDDDNILACSLAAEADYLVTGDSDLLELKSFKGIPIIAPRAFEMLFSD
jgi:putative PIN family toxin of toxin-antitoxin system